MGCCESTPISTHPTKPNTPSPPSPPKLAVIALPESPPPVEEEEEQEETVKEVLSETPISKPPEITTNPIQNPDVKIKKNEPINLTKPTEEEITIVSEISEASEFCSFSGSFSTTTLNDKDKDDGEVTQKVGPRSPAKTPKKCTYSGELRKDRGPIRSNRGPTRSSRPVVQGRNNTTPHRRNVGPVNGVRRDPGEVSLRRSKSPAPRGQKGRPAGRHNGVTGSSVTGQSGCKSPVKKVEESQRKVEKQDDDVLGENGSSESLENPLVSLECFIFL